MKINRFLFIIVAIFMFILSGCHATENKNNGEQIQNSNSEKDGDISLENRENQSQNTSSNNTEAKLGYVCNFTRDNKSFEFEPVEWITINDTEQIVKLGLDIDRDMPGGFYIHSVASDKESYEISDNTEYQIIDWEQNGELSITDAEGFENHIIGMYESKILCWVNIYKGSVTNITERYVP